MAGPEPLKVAMAEKHPLASLRADIEEFAAALTTTEADQTDETADSYDGMHAALELVLAEGPDLGERIRYLLSIAGLAARFTETDVNPHRELEDHVATPLKLTHYLLVEPALHAAVTLHRHDDDDAIRARMLSLMAEISPPAAGGLASEFPDLTGDDPRFDPASRVRALRWIENALRLAREESHEIGADTDLGCSADARALVATAIAAHDLPADRRELSPLADQWPTHRIVSAGAEAAASILRWLHAADRADEVFAES
jgi:hypothetical protein